MENLLHARGLGECRLVLIFQLLEDGRIDPLPQITMRLEVCVQLGYLRREVLWSVIEMLLKGVRGWQGRVVVPSAQYGFFEDMLEWAKYSCELAVSGFMCEPQIFLPQDHMMGMVGVRD